MTNQLLENEKLGALTLEDLVFFVTLCEELSLSETAKGRGAYALCRV